MPRVKRGVAAHRRHKKVLALTKGHRATKHTLYRRAHESMMKSLAYAYAHRRERKGDMRKLWISRINAGVRLAGMTYGRFIQGLTLAGVAVNRKMLADLAVKDGAAFGQFVELARTNLPPVQQKSSQVE
ncbi:MAG: 50S ribosomal protein L20 [Chloroflexi bacterium]|nr:50S ribosomal protein L20 [Chloroflexota bacterium]